MQRSTQRKPIAQARSVILAGLALLVSGTAMAQQPVYICDSDITMDALGEQPFFINEPIPIVITLGAGDVFHGAFAFGLIEGWETATTLRFAAAAAALRCLPW